MEERDEFRLIFEFLGERSTEAVGRQAQDLSDDEVALLQKFSDGTLSKADHPSVLALLSENPAALKHFAGLLRAMEEAENSSDPAKPG